METYEKILDNRSNQMEFDAKIAGVELKTSGSSAKQAPQETQQPSLVQRLKNKKQSEMQSEAAAKGSAKFSDGVGYKAI